MKKLILKDTFFFAPKIVDFRTCPEEQGTNICPFPPLELPPRHLLGEETYFIFFIWVYIAIFKEIKLPLNFNITNNFKDHSKVWLQPSDYLIFSIDDAHILLKEVPSR